MGEKGAKPDLSGGDLRIAVVVSRFNEDVSKRLLRGALSTLEEHGVRDPDVLWVPGSLELPVTALALAERGNHDAIVCLGCVIRGETTHYDYVCAETSRGLQLAQLDTGVPIIFCVLTCDTLEQAIDRAGLKGGNKGFEAGLAAIEMAHLSRKLRANPAKLAIIRKPRRK